MNPELTRTIIESFFGPPVAGASIDTPQGVLDLPPGEHSGTAVNAAFARRLALLAAHPRSQSREAQVARNLLHNAVLSLLGIATAESASPSKPASPTAQGAPSTAPRADPQLLAEAHRLLARTGTIDGAAITHLRALAVARGLPPEAATRAISMLASSSDEPARSGAARPRADAARFTPVEPLDEGQRLVRVAVYGVGALLIILALALGGLYLLVRSTAKLPVAATPLPTPPVVERELARAARAEEPPPSSESQPDPSQILREARAAASATTHEAAQAFAAANDILSRWWFLLDPGQRTAASESLVEAFLRHASIPAAADQMLRALSPTQPGSGAAATALTPLDVSRAAWSAGILARLARERDLPADLGVRLAAVLEPVIGRGVAGGATSFVAGARIALTKMPLRIVSGATSAPMESADAASPSAAADPLTQQPPAAGARVADPALAARAFERWERCTRALGEGPASGQQAEALVLDGLEQIMVSGPEPTEDRAVYSVIQTAIARLRWRAEDPSRRRLIAWFARPDISVADLSVATGALVRDSAAEGVDLTMTLSPLAAPEARAALRDRYAKAWSIDSATKSSGAVNWATVARAEIAAAHTTRGLLEDLRSTAVLSLLSQAAWKKARGEVETAHTLVTIEVPRLKALALAPAEGASLTAAFTATDGSWAVRFLNDRTAGAKIASLRELESSGALGQADADVLIEAAFCSAAGDVRAAAQRTARRFSDNPTVLNAALKLLPRAQRSRGVAELVGFMAIGNTPAPPDIPSDEASGRTIASWAAPTWPFNARRALVEALLERIARGGTGNSIDRLASALAESYARMAGEPVGPTGVSEAEAAATATGCAQRLYTTLRARCQRYPSNDRAPFTLDRLDARRAGRLAVAVGPVQAFVAEQVACVEALGYLVCAERPAAAAQSSAVLGALAQRRRNSDSIADQMKAAESAMLRLHLLRAGEDGGVE